MRVQLLVLIIAVFGLPGLAHAHQDAVIRLEGKDLHGLPKAFAPATFDPEACRLRIATREMTCSPLLGGLFDQPHDLQITASWYHDRRTLPPYLALKIQPKSKDFSYTILLALDSLEIIDLSVTLQESTYSRRHLRIALSEEERNAIKKSVAIIE